MDLKTPVLTAIEKVTPRTWATVVALLVALLLLTWGVAALAAEASLTWTAPTARENGAPLAAGELAEYELECTGFTPTGGTRGACPMPPVKAPGTATGVTMTGTISPLGGTAYFRARVKDTLGLYSAWTSEASKVFAPNPPLPPTITTIAAVAGMLQAPVFSVTAAGARGTYFGVIDLGKPCTGAPLFTYRTKAFYLVDRADVRLWGSTSLRLAAPCRVAS
jgi:hypothetical protein